MNRADSSTRSPSLKARALGLGLSAEATLELAAVAGFEGMGLLVRDLLDAGGNLREVRARIGNLGLRGGAQPLSVAWRGEATRFVHVLEQLSRLTAAADILVLVRTAIWVMPESPEWSEWEAGCIARLTATADLHLRRLGAITHILADHGCRLGLEVVGVVSFRFGHGWLFVTRRADLNRWLGTLPNKRPAWASASIGFTWMRHATPSRWAWPGASIASSGFISPTCPRWPLPINGR